MKTLWKPSKNHVKSLISLIKPRRTQFLFEVLSARSPSAHSSAPCLHRYEVGWSLRRGSRLWRVLASNLGRRWLEKWPRWISKKSKNDGFSDVSTSLGHKYGPKACYEVDAILLDSSCADPLHRRAVRVEA